MNVKGAQKAYHDYLKETHYGENDWIERALHAEAVLEVIARTRIFGDPPHIEDMQGNIIYQTQPITPENFPDFSILDLDALLTDDDLRHIEALARKHGDQP